MPLVTAGRASGAPPFLEPSPPPTRSREHAAPLAGPAPWRPPPPHHRPACTPHLRSLLEHLGEARGLGDVERHDCAAEPFTRPPQRKRGPHSLLGTPRSQAGSASSVPWPAASREGAARAARTADDPRSGRSVGRSLSAHRLSARARADDPRRGACSRPPQWTRAVGRWVIPRVGAGSRACLPRSVCPSSSRPTAGSRLARKEARADPGVSDVLQVGDQSVPASLILFGQRVPAVCCSAALAQRLARPEQGGRA